MVLRSIRITQEWRRAVVLRLGRFHAVKGPGLYLLWPIDTVATIIDLRIQTANITAEQALTRDTVAVGVDAIIFWQVEDARAAAVNIVNYAQAIERVAQTIAARDDRQHRSVAPAVGPAHRRRGAAAHDLGQDPRPGAWRCARSRFATWRSRPGCRTR